MPAPTLIKILVVFVVSNFISNAGMAQIAAASKVLEAVHDAHSAQVGLATIFRFKAIQIGDKSNADLVMENERFYFQVRTAASAPDMNENTLLVRLGNNVTQEGIPKKRYDLSANVKARIFAAHGSDMLPMEPKDITAMSKEKEWSRSIELQWNRLNVSLMALPFLGMDAFYFEKHDLKTVKSRFATFRPSYESEGGMLSVWEHRKTGGVIELTMSDDAPGLPVENSFYLRPSGRAALKEGDDLGELIYRTKTSWHKSAFKTSFGRSKSKEILVPRRIQLEELPNSHNKFASHKVIEVITAWKRIPDDFLTPECFQHKIPIENEFYPPNEPISDLFYEMHSELRRVVSQIEKNRSSKQSHK